MYHTSSKERRQWMSGPAEQAKGNGPLQGTAVSAGSPTGGSRQSQDSSAVFPIVT